MDEKVKSLHEKISDVYNTMCNKRRTRTDRGGLTC